MKKAVFTKLILIFLVSFFIVACGEGITIEVFFDDSSAISYKVGSPRDKRLTFFDINEFRQIRSIPNNLSSGSLAGRVQFAQTHTIDPNGNEEKKQPSLIPYRDALLLFTPHENLQSLKVTVKGKYDNKPTTFQATMEQPRKMPKSDYNNGNGKPDITYSKRSWSARMPYNVVSPEMEITFEGVTTGGATLTGELLGEDIEFGAPIEAVFLHIKLGMVTDRVVTKADYPQYISFDMIEEPEWSIAEYFQTVPFAKMVNGQYEDKVLEKVIINNGTIYDKNHLSPFPNPNAHRGDMREDVAKATVSVGINLANKGVASSPLDQNHERSDDLFYFTLHHAIGNYKNNATYNGENKGFTMHGMSGGNGIGTLYMSSGNEFSHEVGHAYAAVGHWPYISESSEGSIHSYNTGWGYDAYRNRMRANIDWRGQNIHSYDKEGWWITPFQETYQWNSDAQASGIPNGSISRYTHSTAWTTMAVQKKMAGRYLLSDKANSDGKYEYKVWNQGTRSYDIIGNGHEFYKEWDGKTGQPAKYGRLMPSKVGVPVITILGGYDPENPHKALLYPYFRGNWGNVFDELFLDSKPTDTTAYLEIEYHDNKPNKYVKLYDKRYSKDIINKLHINIAESDKPSKITLCVNGQNKGSITIEKTVYDKPMVQAVTIGKEHGYNQVIEADIKYLQDNLTNMNKDNYILDYKAKNRLDTLIYHNKLDNLTGNAKIIAEDYKKTQDAFDKIDMTIENNYVALENNDSVADEELRKVIKDVGFGEVTYLFNQAIINGKCIEVKYGEESFRQVVVANCNETPNQRWAMDSKGRIHSAIMPGYCLSSDSMEKLVLCSESDKQKWKINETHKDKGIVYESVSNHGKCIDHNVGKNVIGIYNCTGNPNQIFKNPIVEDNAKYFAIMGGGLIEEIWKYIPATQGNK